MTFFRRATNITLESLISRIYRGKEVKLRSVEIRYIEAERVGNLSIGDEVRVDPNAATKLGEDETCKIKRLYGEIEWWAELENGEWHAFLNMKKAG